MNRDKEYSELKENDINEISDDNIIAFCIKNILESTYKENMQDENFLQKKNKELNTFIENNSPMNDFHNKESDTYIENNGLEFNNINDECFLGDLNKMSVNAKMINKNSSLIAANYQHLRHNKKKRKRSYINIDKLEFDFEEEDFASNSNIELIHVNPTNEKRNNNYIDLENKIIKELLTPPLIPFNEDFQKTNKEVSDLYKKSKNEHGNLNMYLASQFLCLQDENTFENQSHFISNNYDTFMMNKLNVISSYDECNMNQNKDLKELLKYLMSWYFSGYYSGKMSIISELRRK